MIGLSGKSVLCPVEELIKEDFEYATTQLLNLEVTIVRITETCPIMIFKFNVAMTFRHPVILVVWQSFPIEEVRTYSILSTSS